LKILVLRFSSIGDIVLATPVIRALKTQLTGAEVHVATKQNFAQVLQHNPYIDKLHFLIDFGINPLAAQLKEEKFDFVVDLHNNARTWRLRRMLGVAGKAFNKLNRQKWLLVNFKINLLPKVHIVERYLAAAAPLGIVDDGKGLDFFIPEEAEVPISELPVTHRNGYWAYAIGGQHYTKKLPVDRMIDLLEKLQQPVVLLGGKEDATIARALESYFNRAEVKSVPLYNACGKYSLHQSASLLRQSLAVITHDTGLMHIAAALGKKVYSIWGNTVPDFGMYPFRTEFEVLERPGLYCRPCSKIGYDRCPLGHFKCMREIDFNSVEWTVN
jgi:ADP-heptose:LPS heptosyltransferase